MDKVEKTCTKGIPALDLRLTIISENDKKCYLIGSFKREPKTGLKLEFYTFCVPFNPNTFNK